MRVMRYLDCQGKNQLVTATESHYMETCGLAIRMKQMNLWLRVDLSTVYI